MKQQKLFICQHIEHEADDIQGFCLNFECQDSKPQFCLQCCVDPMKHINCKKDLKGFAYISSFIMKFNQNIIDLKTQLDKSFAQVKKKYEEFSKQLEKMKLNFFEISQCLSQQDYQQMKDNLQVIKEGYQYFKNQEEIMKQNQIGTQLINIKKMIEAWNFDTEQQQIQGINDQCTLQQGLQLLNQHKWQQAYELLQKNIKYLEKKLSLATLFQSISLIEMNEIGKGIITRDQAKKINCNLYKDLLDFSNLELNKNSQNTFIIIAKSYALNDDKKFQQAIELCEQILKGQPQNLHALYRKCIHLFSKQNMNRLFHALIQHSKTIQIIVQVIQQKVFVYNINKLIKISIRSLKKYEDAIICYDKAIQIDPNDAFSYNNKGDSLANLKKYEDAIICYDKAIQINPNYAFAYNNKGICLQVQKGINISIRSLKKYEDTIICYDKAIQIDPNYVNAYINKGDSLTILKKNKLAIENYEMAIKYCSTDEKEFLNRIQQIKNSQ